MSMDRKIKELRERLARLSALASQPLTRAARRRLLRGRGILIGFDADEQPIYIRLKDLQRHGLIIGSSGSGKTFATYLMIAWLMLLGEPCIVIDGKGDLYRDLVALCWHLRKGLDQLVLVNPRERRWVPGINILQSFGATAENHAKTVHEQLKKVFGDKEPKPWIDEWLPVCLAVLGAAGLTLAELYPYARLSDPRFRHAVLASVGDRISPFYKDKWADLELLSPNEASIVTGAIRTRGSFVWGSRSTLPILGQQESTVDFPHIMNTRGSVLMVNAGLHQDLSEDQSRLLGTTIIQQVTSAAWSRQSLPEHERVHCYVFVDEASRFITRDIATAFEVMRGLHVHFILCNQTLAQLRQEDEITAENIVANANVKLVFASSRSDSELLAKEMWSGHLDLKTVRDEVYQTKFRPVESTRTIHSYSSSSSDGSSDASGWGEAANMGASWNADGVSTESAGSGSSYMHGSSSSRSSSSGESTVEVPFMEAHEFVERSSTAYYSVDDLYELATGSLTAQAVQHAVLGVRGQAPQSIVTPTITPLTVPEELLTPYLEALYQRHGRPTAEVMAEIESRVERYIAQFGSSALSSFNDAEFFKELGDPTKDPQKEGRS